MISNHTILPQYSQAPKLRHRPPSFAILGPFDFVSLNTRQVTESPDATPITAAPPPQTRPDTRMSCAASLSAGIH
jgi:hypothetical protein